MLPRDELLESIDILVQHAVKETTQIYTAIVIAIGNDNTCTIRVNGKKHTNITYYGETPKINKSYRVFAPNGSMNQAFIIIGGGSSSGGSGATDYNALSNKPSINNNTLSGNQTSSQLGLYGTNNPPPYPVTSVNGQTGDVIIQAGGGDVNSVNGKTGDVVLDASDVGALPSTTVIPSNTSQLINDSDYVNQEQAKNAAPVQSVDGVTGAVVTNAVKTTEQSLTDTQKQQARENIGAGTSSFDGDYNSLSNKPTIPTKVSQLENDSDYATETQVDAKYTKPADGIPKSDLSNDVQTSLNKANTALQEAPVTSVNNKTGAVQLSAADVGALPSTTVIPSKTSELDNDSGYITDIPIASSTQLGGVKIGGGLSITDSGVLSATGGGTADAVEWKNVLDKPTTISGYGITDAKIDNGTIIMGDQSITPYTADNNNVYIATLTGNSADTYAIDKSFDEIYEAIINKKIVYAYSSYENVYYTVGAANDIFIIFTNNDRARSKFITYTSSEYITVNIWSLERTSDKVTSISASSTNTQYPSAKAVWDLVSSSGGGDMLKSVYDATNAVENAGGIVDYVATKIPEIPTNIVKYTALAPVESTTLIDADTLQGHNSTYFATQSGLNSVDVKTTTNANNIETLQIELNTNNSNISVLQSGKLDKSGGTMAGALVAQTNTDYTTRQVRNIIISTAEPSGGQNGDIWIRYSE